MQFANFYSPAAFLVVATFIALATCDSTSSSATPVASAAAAVTQPSISSSANNPSVTEVPAQNDDPKADANTVPPTRAPSDVTVATKPPLVHTSTTMKIPDATPGTTNATSNATGTTGNVSTKKDDGKGGASRGSPGFVVISLIFLSLGAIYA